MPPALRFGAALLGQKWWEGVRCRAHCQHRGPVVEALPPHGGEGAVGTHYQLRFPVFSPPADLKAHAHAVPCVPVPASPPLANLRKFPLLCDAYPLRSATEDCQGSAVSNSYRRDVRRVVRLWQLKCSNPDFSTRTHIATAVSSCRPISEKRLVAQRDPNQRSNRSMPWPWVETS